MSKFLVFIDESGDHNLNKSSLDGLYNIFVLVAVVFSEDNYQIFNQKFRAIKQTLRGDDNLILHTAEITRPNKSKDKRNFLFNNQTFRTDFYQQINQLIQKSEFSIIHCIIEKDKLIQNYGIQAEDPYLFSFENLLNHILRTTWWGRCGIYPEKRSHVEDIKLETMLLKLKTMGTAYYTGSEIQNRIDEFRFTKKEENKSWSQLVDLIASPIGRHYLGKKVKPWNEVDYEIIKQKFTNGGTTIFP